MSLIEITGQMTIDAAAKRIKDEISRLEQLYSDLINLASDKDSILKEIETKSENEELYHAYYPTNEKIETIVLPPKAPVLKPIFTPPIQGYELRQSNNEGYLRAMVSQ